MNRALSALFSMVALAAVAVAVLVLTGGQHAAKTSAKACPAGQRLVSESGEREDKGEAGDYESHFRGKCAPVAHPESNRDIAKFSEFASTRQGADSPQAFAKAVRQHDRLAHSAASSSVPG